MLDRELEPEFMDTDEEADGYDAMDHIVPNTAFVDRLIELGADGKILDLGCGPGHMPPMIADRLAECEVLGLDAAPTMLAHAERHRQDSPHRDRIRYTEGDAKNLIFDDGHFDAVYSNTVMHHIPDPLPFLYEAFRVMAPGGVLLIRDLFRPDSDETVDQLVDLHGADANDYQRAMFRASLKAALTPAELKAMATEAGLKGFEVVVDGDRHMSLQIRANRP